MDITSRSHELAKSIKRVSLRVTRESIAPYSRVCMSSVQVAGLAETLLGHEDQEVVLVFFLDAKNRVTGFSEVGRGSLDQCIVHPREVFRAAVVLGAMSIILCHNHPSGDPTPSDADRELTRRVRHAGEVLGIALLDHVVVAHGAGHFSFLDAGQLT